MDTFLNTEPVNNGSLGDKLLRDETLHAERSSASRRTPASKQALPQALVTLAAWAWRIIAIALAVALIGWALLKISLLVVSLLIALLLTVIAEPFNTMLRRKLHWPPAAAAGLSVLLLLLLLAAIVGGSGTGIYQGFLSLRDNVQGGINRLVEWITATFPHLPTDIESVWREAQAYLTTNSNRILGGVLSASSSITSFFAGLVLTFFALFFFLKDGRRLWHWSIRLFPAQYRNDINEAGIRAWVTLQTYTRTQAIVACADAVGISIIAACLKTPFSLLVPIAALVFLGAFIPIVGAFLSGFVAVIVVLVNTGSPILALVMLLGVWVVQQIEGHLLQPLLQGNALNIHALAIVLLVAGGTALGGIAGALFTVPITAALNAMVLYLHGHDIYPYLNDMTDRPGGKKKDFSIYAEEYWAEFEQTVAQHYPPRFGRRRKNHLQEKLPDTASPQLLRQTDSKPEECTDAASEVPRAHNS